MKLSKQHYETEVDNITTSYYPELVEWLSQKLDVPKHHIEIRDWYDNDIIYVKHKNKKEFEFYDYVDYTIEEMIYGAEEE
jgi:poly-beta-hydroxyalkanoate depolymerase